MARLHMTIQQRLALGAAALVAVGAAGGAGAVALTRPSIEMAPTVATPINRLATSNGIVTVKGRVAEVFGDRFVVQDGSGRAMIDAGRDGTANVTRGNAVLVQGRYDEGQLRAHFLVGPSGQVDEVGPRRRPRGPGADAPPPPPPPPGAGPAGAPPPPPGVGPAGTPPPPPGAGPAGTPPPPGAGPAGTPPPPAVGPAGTPPPPPPVNGAAPPAPVAGAAPRAPAPAPIPAR